MFGLTFTNQEICCYFKPIDSCVNVATKQDHQAPSQTQTLESHGPSETGNDGAAQPPTPRQYDLTATGTRNHPNHLLVRADYQSPDIS